MNTLAKYILHAPNALCKPLCMAALLCGLTALTGVVTGCEDKPLAFNYCPTPVEGWEPGDTLKFHVDTVKTAGTYRIDLGVRTSSSTPYPFQSLWLVVRQHWHNPNRELCDTVMFKLTNQRGDPNGHGVTIYQYDMPCNNSKSLPAPVPTSASATSCAAKYCPALPMWASGCRRLLLPIHSKPVGRMLGLWDDRLMG